MSKIFQSFKVCHGSSSTLVLKGKSSFDSKDEAVEATKEYKANPKINNPNMSDSNAEYWKSQTYTVIEEILILNEVETI